MKRREIILKKSVEAPAFLLAQTIVASQVMRDKTLSATGNNKVLRKGKDYWHMLGPGLTTGACRRRSVGHRHVQPDRRAVRLPIAVAGAANVSAHVVCPGNVRPHRPGHRARLGGKYPRTFQQESAVHLHHDAVCGEHYQHRRRPRRDGQSRATAHSAAATLVFWS